MRVVKPFNSASFFLAFSFYILTEVSSYEVEAVVSLFCY